MSEASSEEHAQRVMRILYGVSGVVFVVVAGLMVGPRPAGVAGAIDVSMLPWVNAALNSLTALLIVSGVTAVRSGRLALHKRLMTTALGVSACFLCSYIVYHWFSVGPAHYQGGYRGPYVVLLLTHIVLAAIILPLALTTWARGWLGQLEAHRRAGPRTAALWLYVAVSGVLIVWMTQG